MIKAHVLPDPVSATPNKSRPVCPKGIAALWIGVGSWYPTFRSVSRMIIGKFASSQFRKPRGIRPPRLEMLKSYSDRNREMRWLKKSVCVCDADNTSLKILQSLSFISARSFLLQCKPSLLFFSLSFSIRSARFFTVSLSLSDSKYIFLCFKSTRHTVKKSASH